ncbi:MAG: hypothetical protein C4335_11330 [Armatimonadota bacterium]
MNWQAKWIWHPGESAPRNFFWAVRKAFTLPNTFTNVILHLTADSRYSVWVNGQYVGHGPVRAFTHRWRYDTYDISSYVCGGENVVAVLVHHFGHSTFQYLQARGGLLAQVECDERVVIATDETWKGTEHPAYERRMPRMACQQAWAEAFDARRDLAHWQLPGYDDSAWQNAVVVGEAGCEPWKELRARDIPFLTQEPVQPVCLLRVQAVRPPKQVWTFDLKPNLLPGDLTANPRGLVGLAVTVVECSQPTTFTIYPAYQSGRALRIDGQDITWQEAHEGVPLTAGEHLLVLNVTQPFYHDWFIGLVFDDEAGDMRFRSPLGDGYPWVTVGPFTSEEEPAFQSAWQASSPAQIASHPAVKPIQPAHTASVNVFGETVYAKPMPAEVHVENPGALLAASLDDTAIHPRNRATLNC